MSAGEVTAAIAKLRELLGDRVSTASAVRDRHAKDESWHAPRPPDAVCFPESTDEVAAIARTCSTHLVPIVPFGAGTSLEGHVQAVRGGITVDLTRMAGILSVNEEDFDVRYGTMRENVLALKVVLAGGEVIRTSRRARKSSAGYDLTRVFVGSEGTLGIITEVTLRLHGIPEAIRAAVVSFEDIQGAIRSVIATIQSGVPVARIELLDETGMDAVNRYSKLSYPVKPTLFLEFHGSETGVEEQVEEARSITQDHGGGEFAWATRTEERSQLWRARHDAYYASLALHPGCKGLVTDVCVPISRLGDCIIETKKDLESSTLAATLVGHAGDGNFHLQFLIDPENPAELAEMERLNERLIERALALDGTCTGEHGIGLGKRRFLEAEHGAGVAVMRAIKRALDPDDIMNPGKIFAD
jgi:D-lactate dehydrogenase (cytochrome)